MRQSAYLIIGLFLGALASYVLTRQYSKMTESTAPQTVCDTTYDTVPCPVPVPRDSLVVRYVEAKLPVSEMFNASGLDSIGDSIPVQLPIVQKEYKTDDYQAWVSGPVNPQLDSLNVFRRTYVETVYQTPPSLPSKPKRWGLGVQAGVGITPSKIEPYLGIGVSYNILSW